MLVGRQLDRKCCRSLLLAKPCAASSTMVGTRRQRNSAALIVGIGMILPRKRRTECLPSRTRIRGWSRLIFVLLSWKGLSSLGYASFEDPSSVTHAGWLMGSTCASVTHAGCLLVKSFSMPKNLVFVASPRRMSLEHRCRCRFDVVILEAQSSIAATDMKLGSWMRLVFC